MSSSFLVQCILLFGCVLLSRQTAHDAVIHTLYSWKYPEFKYPSEELKLAAKEQGQYIPEHAAILDSDYYFSPVISRKRIFVTTPQFRDGIPATLSEISREKDQDSFLLMPYPNWELQSLTQCEGPVSVYRIHIDKCGLLWVLDTGRVETFTKPRNACPPKLLIYDLNKDILIKRHEFFLGTVNDRSNLANLVTESYTENCLDSVAYIADVNAYALIVYDLEKDKSWRVENKMFYPFPHQGTIMVKGVSFELMDGIIGLTLSAPKEDPRRLFFHSLASVRESWVCTSVLKNATIIQDSNLLRTQIFNSEDVRVGQSMMEVMTEDGILIYSILPKNAIGCWNSKHPFTKEHQHIIYQNDEDLQYISGMKLKDNYLLITTSRLQNYIAGKLKYPEVKYRIIIIDDVKQLLRETPCLEPIGGKSKQSPSAKPKHESSGY